MDITTLSNFEFENKLYIHFLFYLLLIFLFKKFASRNPKVIEQNSEYKVSIGRQALLIICVLFGTMFGYLFLIDKKTKEEIKVNRIIPKTITIIFLILCILQPIIDISKIINSSSDVLPYNIDPRAFLKKPILGYETTIQYWIHEAVNDFFTNIALAVYAYNFRWSDTKWYTKIRKGIGYFLLYSLILSITDIHYFELPELLPFLVMGIFSFLLIKNYKKDTNKKKDCIMEESNTENGFIEKNNSQEENINRENDKLKEEDSNRIPAKKRNESFPIKRVISNIFTFYKKTDKAKSSSIQKYEDKIYEKNESLLEKYNKLSFGKKWWILVYTLYFFVNLLCYVGGVFPPKDKLAFLIFFDCIIPIVIYIIYLSFKKYRRKTIIFFSAISILAIITTISLVGYDIYEDKQRELERKRERIERERIENTPKINRTFLNCQLGDTIHIREANNWTNEYWIEHLSYIEHTANGDNIVLENLKYGKYNVSKMNFFYYENKLTEVKMQIDITYSDYINLWTYDEIIEMFKKKEYSADWFYNEKYSNVKQYFDKFTRVRVGYYEKKSNYFVLIRYYDKTSGYEEMLESGF